jgi:hypothetical protein
VVPPREPGDEAQPRDVARAFLLVEPQAQQHRERREQHRGCVVEHHLGGLPHQRGGEHPHHTGGELTGSLVEHPPADAPHDDARGREHGDLAQLHRGVVAAEHREHERPRVRERRPAVAEAFGEGRDVAVQDLGGHEGRAGLIGVEAGADGALEHVDAQDEPGQDECHQHQQRQSGARPRRARLDDGGLDGHGHGAANLRAARRRGGGVAGVLPGPGTGLW